MICQAVIERKWLQMPHSQVYILFPHYYSVLNSSYSPAAHESQERQRMVSQKGYVCVSLLFVNDAVSIACQVRV